MLIFLRFFLLFFTVFFLGCGDSSKNTKRKFKKDIPFNQLGEYGYENFVKERIEPCSLAHTEAYSEVLIAKDQFDNAQSDLKKHQEDYEKACQAYKKGFASDKKCKVKDAAKIIEISWKIAVENKICLDSDAPNT